MENNIIDFGEVFVPESWNDINLKKYQEIEKYYSDKDKKFDTRQVIHILCDKSEDEINDLPLEFLEMILDKLKFMNEPPSYDKPTNMIEIDGETYIINHQNQLKTGEFLAVDTIMKDDPRNYSAILAVLCRKQGEKYDAYFENEVVEDRIKMFERQPITKILPIVFFFLNLSVVSNLPSLLSSKVVGEINLTVKNIETLRKNGHLSTFSTKRLIKKLNRLKKSIKCT